MTTHIGTKNNNFEYTQPATRPIPYQQLILFIDLLYNIEFEVTS